MQIRMVLKLLVLGGVTLVMMAVLGSISGLARERKNRQYQVECDIANSYAGRQLVVGPVFSVVCREFWTERLYNSEKDTWYDKELSADRTVYYFPKEFTYDGELAAQERYRGIFKANVFQSTGRLAGQVEFPAKETLSAKKNSRLEPVSAQAHLFISDPRGISKVPEFDWNGTPIKVAAGSGIPESPNGIHVELPDIEALWNGSFEFAMDLNIHGMGGLEFVPIGSENRLRMESAWPHPSFTGDFLATDRAVSEVGFAAEWDVNGLASSAQQSVRDGQVLRAQRLGVSLIDPVNPYPLTDRALKYGFLFVFITFSAFFLFEMLEELRIHPVQYGLVGLAQAIFFLLLLSLSEHVGFGLSYGVASLATIGLITFYLCSVMRGLKRGLSFGALMALLYGVLYVLLQSEDHALVAGSILLFGLMTVVMILTRKVDWYALGARPKEVVQ